MDPATRVALAGLVYTLVLPVGAAVAVLAIGRRVRPRDDQPALVTLALTVGVAVAQIGLGGTAALTLASADGWLLYGPLVAGLAGALVDRFAPRRPLAVALVALVVTALVTARLTGALAALWSGGPSEPLATAWILDAALVGAAMWIALDLTAARVDRPTPVVLGPLALALAVAAVATALSGSVRMAQSIGSLAAVTAVVGLAGWRWPALRAAHGAVAVAAAALIAALLHAHHFVELPRAVATLALIAPLGALAAFAARGHKAVFAAVGLSALIGLGALGLTLAREQAKAAADAAPAEGDGDGSYYPY
ncbi:MAG: hypothetical protein H6703_05195 [Myxococcales bacterium]|nr:hypothetical protein [Myxococcales bacterium]